MSITCWKSNNIYDNIYIILSKLRSAKLNPGTNIRGTNIDKQYKNTVKIYKELFTVKGGMLHPFPLFFQCISVFQSL